MKQNNQLVINWHILEKCNFGCGFCFAHWEKDSHEIWEGAHWRPMLHELARIIPGDDAVPEGEWSGARLNFAGGEPMLLWKNGNGVLPKILSEAQKLGFSLSIITNGWVLKKDHAIIRRIAPQLQILGISMDSANAETNRIIGRCGKKNSDKQVTAEEIADIFRLAREVNPTIECKLNTVVNAKNWREDLRSAIRLIAPDRWKIFQMLPIADTEEIRRKQMPFKVTDAQFRAFLERHGEFSAIINSEDNEEMTDSYLMVDPFGRFYQNEPDGENYRHIHSDPIHETGAKKALTGVPFDANKFRSRYRTIMLRAT